MQAAQQALDVGRVRRGQGQGDVVERLGVDAAGADQDHRAERGVAAGADDQVDAAGGASRSTNTPSGS